MFAGKKVVVGITGGIAAYKAADIVSWLKQKQADVQVIMTAAACEFITSLTLQTLSGNPVAVDILAAGQPWPVIHISTVEGADLFVVVPATANYLAKLAYGLADDVLSAASLAATCPIVVAPAMNVNMYQNPATQKNLACLKERGIDIIEPGIGRLACGTEGKGRLADIEDIKAKITTYLLPDQTWLGKKVLITAGPTREAIDPVRFISNRSSGRMGYALAAAAQKRGAKVTLVSGPVALNASAGVDLLKVESAAEMQKAVLAVFDEMDIVIKTAAVSDFKAAEPKQKKIKKNNVELTLNLTANPDILKDLGTKKKNQLLIGFAAETNDVINYAKGKLQEKNLDMIIVNDVTLSGAGFDVDTNIVTLLDKYGHEESLPQLAKTKLAEIILDAIGKLPGF